MIFSNTANILIYQILGLLLFFAFYLFGWILFSIGLYHDAQGTYNRNSLMWGLLTGFLGWIPALVYFCTRKNDWPKISCPHCSRILSLPQPSSACPFCQQETGVQMPPEHPGFPALRQKGKKQMITGAIFSVAGYVLYFTAYILMILNYFN